MEADKKYTVYIEAFPFNKDSTNSIKRICIANNVDKAEAYFEKEGDE